MLSDTHAYLTSAAMAEEIDADLLRHHAHNLDVKLTNVTEDLSVIGVMGPDSRTLLAQLTDTDLSNDTFPWLCVRSITVAEIDVRALRVSYIGELGWELHVPHALAPALFDAIWKAGQPLGIGLYGAYAMNSMRLEKGYRAWGADLTTERAPYESGVSVRDGKDSSRTWEMKQLRISDDTADPFYAHTVKHEGRPVGVVTSAAYGHRVKQSLALAYLREPGLLGGLTVEILGEDYTSDVLIECPFDPQNTRLRTGASV